MWFWRGISPETCGSFVSEAYFSSDEEKVQNHMLSNLMRKCMYVNTKKFFVFICILCEYSTVNWGQLFLDTRGQSLLTLILYLSKEVSPVEILTFTYKNILYVCIFAQSRRWMAFYLSIGFNFSDPVAY